MGNLTPHFTVAEFCASDTAVRLGIDNSLPASLIEAARSTCVMLETIRAFLCVEAGREVPLVLTSGYRCPALNRAIGSGPGSDHVRALAADFKAPSFGSAFEVAAALAPRVSELGIGQLIHEFGSWVHVSTDRPTRDVNRILTISRAGTMPGIVEA